MSFTISTFVQLISIAQKTKPNLYLQKSSEIVFKYENESKQI